MKLRSGTLLFQNHENNYRDSTQQISSFFNKLPSEIRNMVYKTVFNVGDSAETRKLFCGFNGSCGFKAAELPKLVINEQLRIVTFPANSSAPSVRFLETCRQIYVEALPLLYASFRFKLISPSVGHYFLRQIGPNGLENLNQLEIALPSVKSRGFQREVQSHRWQVCQLRKCRSLIALVVHTSRRTYSDENGRAKDPHEEPLSRLRGLKHVEFKFFEGMHLHGCLLLGYESENFFKTRKRFEEALRNIMIQPRES